MDTVSLLLPAVVVLAAFAFVAARLLSRRLPAEGPPVRGRGSRLLFALLLLFDVAGLSAAVFDLDPDHPNGVVVHGWVLHRLGVHLSPLTFVVLPLLGAFLARLGRSRVGGAFATVAGTALILLTLLAYPGTPLTLTIVVAMFVPLAVVVAWYVIVRSSRRLLVLALLNLAGLLFTVSGLAGQPPEDVQAGPIAVVAWILLGAATVAGIASYFVRAVTLGRRFETTLDVTTSLAAMVAVLCAAYLRDGPDGPAGVVASLFVIGIVAGALWVLRRLPFLPFSSGGGGGGGGRDTFWDDVEKGHRDRETAARATADREREQRRRRWIQDDDRRRRLRDDEDRRRRRLDEQDRRRR